MKWLERLFASRTARLGIVLATLPLKTLTELGFTIAFGVLLDTFLVRSVLVPALVFDMGARVWWPSALARPTVHAAEGRRDRRPNARPVAGLGAR